MEKRLNIQLMISIIILIVGIFMSLFKETKLGLDLKGGVYVVLEAIPENNVKIDDAAMSRFIEVLDRRINGIGVAESSVQRAGDNRVIVELPGIDNTEEAVKMIGQTALLEFKLLDENGNTGETLLTGSALKSAKVTYDELGRPQIAFEMTTEGAKVFAEITRNNINRFLAITLDGVIQTAPNINTEIPNGMGVIQGSYTPDEAKSMAMLLNAGALPIKAEIAETRKIGASLGDESILQTKKAGILAIILVWVFMIIFYRLPGIIADISLIFFGFTTFAILNFIDATLTLPGIAGLILSVGMAVDANVIIFERVKEELTVGNTPINSVKQGFQKGFVGILDSNITTLLITTVLFIFGTGPVKGFAVTLTIGTIVSMFSAITVTKVLLMKFIMTFGLKNPKLFGVKKIGGQ